MRTVFPVEAHEIAKACAHPLRIKVLELLDGQVRSPSSMAEELGEPVQITAYHVKALLDAGAIELTGTAQRRGAREHFYTARWRPTITAEMIDGMPR